MGRQHIRELSSGPYKAVQDLHAEASWGGAKQVSGGCQKNILTTDIKRSMIFSFLPLSVWTGMVPFSPFLCTLTQCVAPPSVIYVIPPSYSPISEMTSLLLFLNLLARLSSSSSHLVLPRPPLPKSLHLPLPQITRLSKSFPYLLLLASAC